MKVTIETLNGVTSRKDDDEINFAENLGVLLAEVLLGHDRLITGTIGQIVAHMVQSLSFMIGDDELPGDWADSVIQKLANSRTEARR
jgi:hypothetical protein